ncbi:hypothetical protein GCM10014713_54360 [Streptomyces purpureus]|uniref:Uncharacterized protein n=1 Tax=Streptomyces purpureus TaxID=1951 RepID=A0A918HCC5_9ACTN|nr:hypothetical protein GCM10014713_54360 [Streptomyces purpureus]
MAEYQGEVKRRYRHVLLLGHSAPYGGGHDPLCGDRDDPLQIRPGVAAVPFDHVAAAEAASGVGAQDQTAEGAVSDGAVDVAGVGTPGDEVVQLGGR